jgi:2-keto-3-deoxy-L-rhamnonate aldolase RhmA
MIRDNIVKRKMHNGEKSFGAWLHLCSGMSAEIMGDAGFDWILIDMEHGHGDLQTLMSQLQGMSTSTSIPIVRAPWNDVVMIKRILDMGVYGVMIPWINTKAEAESAVQACKYPPDGVRGVARNIRATAYGRDFPEYTHRANDEVMIIAQIETTTAVNNIDEILSVPGIDVVFIGPSDLSASMNLMGQYDHPDLLKAISTVKTAAENHHVALGTLCTSIEQLTTLAGEGYQFLSMGSDAAFVVQKSSELAEMYRNI